MVTDTGGSCTAVLVRPDIIATAAHCAHPDRIAVYRFRVGDGQAGSFALTQIVQHPLYDPDHPRIDWRYRFDIAVARLEAEVPAERAMPYPFGDEAAKDETLFLYSWRKDAGTRPRQRQCPVLEGRAGLVTLGCDVRGGESGSPVLRKTPNGLELVAIISSRAQFLNQPVAQASDVRLRVQPLIDRLHTP